MRWQEIALRLALIYGFLAAIAYDVGVWVAAPLGLLAIASTAELAVRPYAANAVDRLLLGCGAVVTTLIIIGLILNLLPWGLTRVTSAVTWTILSIGVLAWRRGIRTGAGKPAGRISSFAPWVLAASLIIVVAGILALAGVRQSNRQHDLAFALVSTSPHIVVVEIESTGVNESYRILAMSQMPGARQYLSSPLIIKPEGNGKRVLARVPVNIAGAWIINLKSVTSGATVRRLKVNVR